VFTARYGLIAYIKQITFVCLQVNDVNKRTDDAALNTYILITHTHTQTHTHICIYQCHSYSHINKQFTQ